MISILKTMKGATWLRKAGEKPVLSKVTAFFNLVIDLTSWLKRAIPLEPQLVDLMTREEALSYFISDRPDDPRVAKGVMLFEAHPKGHLLTRVFLDKNNQIISGADGALFGRRLIVRSIDSALDDLRTPHNLVIVE
ncbi:MAG: hypothetical protein KAI47_22890 [Deltaproteobacteria bacterium]|nr:hypothetical protein [Deltaproteobacteria bacterium]